MERKYSVAEIDALRNVVESKYLYGWYRTPNRPGGGCIVGFPHYENEKNKAVEERVRTHMLAGHTAEDLIESEADRRRAVEERYRQNDDGAVAGSSFHT